jgi:hypothetical protein
MRFIPEVFAKVRSGFFIGENAPFARVTVEPDWRLRTTLPIYGNSIRGPYRYFQSVTGPGQEIEVPNIQSVQWNRNNGQDVASCTITIANTWHHGNLQSGQLSGQLGNPGKFWPKHGDSNNIWNQTNGRGAYNREGAWDAAFSWRNVLVPHGLIRTYQGYGGSPLASDGSFKSIEQAESNNELQITGVWLIDSITGGSSGTLTLQCRDIGRLLLDQLIYPPTIPNGIYPLEYVPEGETPFESPFGPKYQGGQAIGSKGPIRLHFHSSSVNGTTNTAINGNRPSDAIDGDWKTFAWSAGQAEPKATGDLQWFQYRFNNPMSSINLKPWAGGYTCYISVQVGGTWQGPASNVVPGSGIRYVKKVQIPMAIPDNAEPAMSYDLGTLDAQGFLSNFNPGSGAGYVRLTFDNLYYSGYTASYGGVYRCGIRELRAFRTGRKANPYTAPFNSLPWTYAMASHPVRGYWVVDSSGNFYGFGDAADTSFSQLSMGTNNVGNQFSIVGVTAHPGGKGLWAVSESGQVYARGTDESGNPLPNYGSFFNGSINFSPNFWIPPIYTAVDIAVTHTGNGYWVIYSDGQIRGFGDASPTHAALPVTNVINFMAAYHHGRTAGMTAQRYRAARLGAAIVGHPTRMGFWAVNGSGEVWTSEQLLWTDPSTRVIPAFRGLFNRGYNNKQGNSFRLEPNEFCTSMECTASGDGIWMTFGSGKVAAFGGSANMGPIGIYPENPAANIPVNVQNLDLQAIFRSLVWSITRDPDGTGFYILLADGSVVTYDAKFWGRPGYDGQTGFRWFEGNFDGDWTAIVRELLLWAGFTFYEPSLDGSLASTPPSVYGGLESTGIQTDTTVPTQKFDRRTVMDCIKELAQVVAYDFRIREDGGAEFSSPNIWQAGNFNEFGDRIFATYDVDGNPVPASEGAPGAAPFIPVIDEMHDLFDYTVTLSGESSRSELIIGTSLPDPKDPTSTGFVRKVPSSSLAEVAPGIPSLRNIPRPAMWVSQLFQNEEEMSLMAELISIRMWFSERTAQATCVANPCLSLGDQVRMVDRNTNETFIHLISGIDSQHDNSTGVWTYNITSNWLGDADNWVLSSINSDSPYERIVISERVDRWQSITDRGMPLGLGASDRSRITETTGEFQQTVVQLPYSTTIDSSESFGDEPPINVDPDTTLPTELSADQEQWIFVGTITFNTRVIRPTLRVDVMSAPLGVGADLEVLQGSSTIGYFEDLYQSATIVLNAVSLGAIGSTTILSYEIRGIPSTVGSGALRVTFSGDNVNSSTASGNVLVVSNEQ